MATLNSSWQVLNSTTVSGSGYTVVFRLYGKLNSQDVANNRSNISLHWDYETTYGWITSYDAQDYLTNVGWNDATYREYTSGGTLRSWTGNISHNADGTGSGSCSGRTRMGGVGVDTDWVSASYTLPTIPRASVPTASPNPRRIWQGGAPLTVYTNRKSSSFTHTVTISCGSWSATQTGVGTSTEFNIPYIVGAQFADNTNYATLTVTCVTYNGSTNIGTKTCSVTLQINTEQDHANIGTVTIEDTNARTSAVTQDNSIYIANISTLKATIPLTVSGSYTQLASATVTCGNKTQNYTLSGTSQTIVFEFDKVNASSLSVKVTDKRGNSVTGTKSWTLIQYQPVTATATVGRPSATGSTGVGEITGMAYGGNFGATPNSLTVEMDFKLHSDPNYDPNDTETDTIALGQSGYNSYNQSYTFSYQFDYQYQYDVRFTVSDLFSTVVYTCQMMQGLPILSWDENEVDVFGNLHIHDRSNPTQYQDVMSGFNAILDHNGAKNLLPNTATTVVNNGVTFTVNANGTITANGTVGSGQTYSQCAYSINGSLLKSLDGCIFTGAPNGSDNYRMYIQLAQSPWTTVAYIWGATIPSAVLSTSGVTESATYQVICRVTTTGTSVSNIVFKPMIRDARLASDTFVPYYASRMFIKEENTLTISSGYTTFNYPTGITNTDYFLPIIQSRYASSSLLGWTGSTQKHGDTACYIYVRQGTTQPANNTKITFDAIFIHR